MTVGALVVYNFAVSFIAAVEVSFPFNIIFGPNILVLAVISYGKLDLLAILLTSN